MYPSHSIYAPVTYSALFQAIMGTRRIIKAEKFTHWITGVIKKKEKKGKKKDIYNLDLKFGILKTYHILWLTTMNALMNYARYGKEHGLHSTMQLFSMLLMYVLFLTTNNNLAIYSVFNSVLQRCPMVEVCKQSDIIYYAIIFHVTYLCFIFYN